MDELKYQHNRNDYRWQNIEGNMLPFEPEELAVIIILINKWNQFSSSKMFKNILNDLGIENKALYEIAEKIIDKSLG
ncbi:hypothetical protein [Chryseobacterium daeguense]|uniref:hypothetical protein n=1 Tax=Chryseobacterium daeguense TaxID=412438 RepID=UPI000411241B|nr:hypothetical protein [Chryseobacterium daeguense]